jgi:TolB-like protein/tetratricopeptide (TPR) repeat protein
MNQLFGELKRRNVLRAALAYLAASWFLIQVVETLFPIFGLADGHVRLIVILLVIGFPLVLIFAWVYELTPDGLMRESEIDRSRSIAHHTGSRLDRAIIVGLALGLGYLAVDKFVLEPARDAARDETVARQAVLGSFGDSSIAVLPFVNLSNDVANEYFSDGISEELLSLLSKVPSLRVVSRSSSFSFKGKDIAIPEVARQLNVAHVLEGSVRKAGNQLRINAQLVDASTDSQMWSETYDRTLEEILSIQSDIGRSVVAAIVPVLSPELQARMVARPTESIDAYDFYLRGRDYLRQPTVESTLASAIELFNRAIALDQQFAYAYAGLCEAQLGTYWFARNPESFESAEVACQRALDLDDSSSEVHSALGNLYQTGGQYDKAVREFEAALILQPGSVDTYLDLAETFEAQMLHDKAEATFLRADSVDGGYWAVHNRFGNFLEGIGRYDEAIERYVKVIQLAPDSEVGYNNLANTYLSQGKLVEAERIFSESPSPTRWTFQNRGLVYYYLGDFAKSVEDQKRAIKLAPENYTPWGHLADAYRFLQGNEQNARDAYAKAIQLAERELTINPASLVTIGRLSMYYAYTGQADKAREQIDRMLELSPELGGDSYYAARVMMALGDMDRAYEYFRATIDGGWSRALILSDPDLVVHAGAERFEKL